MRKLIFTDDFTGAKKLLSNVDTNGLVSHNILKQSTVDTLNKQISDGETYGANISFGRIKGFFSQLGITPVTISEADYNTIQNQVSGGTLGSPLETKYTSGNNTTTIGVSNAQLYSPNSTEVKPNVYINGAKAYLVNVQASYTSLLGGRTYSIVLVGRDGLFYNESDIYGALENGTLYADNMGTMQKFSMDEAKNNYAENNTILGTSGDCAGYLYMVDKINPNPKGWEFPGGF